MQQEHNNDHPELDILKQDLAAPQGLLEAAEATLFKRIERFEQDHPAENNAPWEAVVALHEPAQCGSIDTAEQKLFDRISQADHAEPWELYLKKDADCADFAAVVEKLSNYLAVSSTPYSFPVLFSTLSLVMSKYKNVLVALLVLALGLFAFFGWNAFMGADPPVATMLIAPGGQQARSELVRENQTVQSAAGQMLVLSNERGTVIVENGAGITILRARRHRMDYAVDFKEYSPTSSGRVIFAVTRKKTGQEFSVATKEYVIRVVGTVFRLRPQAPGRTAVKVLEGAVRIEGAGISAIVSTGSTFAFNDGAGAYIAGAFDTGSAAAHRPTSAETPAPGRQKPEPQFRHVNKGAPPPRDSLLELAVRLEAPDWKRAVETYRAVLARPGTSAYSREIALFSIGRLLSDNDASAAEVRFAFNAYLKNFPHGTFSGESYLRLADIEYKTDPGRALVWYEHYLQEFPATQNTAAAEYKAGLILLQQNKHERAVVMLSSALHHAKNYPADQVAAIQRTLDNAKNPGSDRNNLGK